MNKKIALIVTLIIMAKLSIDHFYFSSTVPQNKILKNKEQVNSAVKIKDPHIFVHKLNTHLDNLDSLTLEEDYQRALLNIKLELNSPQNQMEFFKYYKATMNGQKGLLKSFFLNKLLITIPGHLSVAKELMAQDAYSKNNPFAHYDIHLGQRPSENFNLSRVHLLQLTQQHSSPNEISKLVPELETLIKKEQNIMVVREAIKTWIYATGLTPDKSWFAHRHPQELQKLSGIIIEN